MRASTLASVLLLLHGTVLASQVTFSYSGTIDRLTYADCTSPSSTGSCSAWSFTNMATSDFANGNAISAGDSFSGIFTYDTATPIGPFGMSSDERQATYLNAGLSASLQVGTVKLPASPWLPFASTGTIVAVVDNRYGWDNFYLSRSYSGPELFATSNLHLLNYSGTLFDGFTLPSSILPSAINSTLFNVGFLRRSDGDQLQVYGTLTGFSFTSAVPEPSTGVLAALGLVMVSMLGKRTGKR